MTFYSTSVLLLFILHTACYEERDAEEINFGWSKTCEYRNESCFAMAYQISNQNDLLRLICYTKTLTAMSSNLDGQSSSKRQSKGGVVDQCAVEMFDLIDEEKEGFLLPDQIEKYLDKIGFSDNAGQEILLGGESQFERCFFLFTRPEYSIVLPQLLTSLT